MMRVLTPLISGKTPTLLDATFACPDLTTFCRLDELGLVVTGQRLGPDRAVLACRVVEADDWCRRCGCQGVAGDTTSRRLAREPFGWRIVPTKWLIGPHQRLERIKCYVVQLRPEGPVLPGGRTIPE